LLDLPLRLRFEHTVAIRIQSVGRGASFVQAAPLQTVEENFSPGALRHLVRPTACEHSVTFTPRY
jgi:hypothetical protein